MGKPTRIRVHLTALGELKRARNDLTSAIASVRAKLRRAVGPDTRYTSGHIERWLMTQPGMGRVRIEHCRPYFASSWLFLEAAKSSCLPISSTLRSHVLRYPADFWERRVGSGAKSSEV